MSSTIQKPIQVYGSIYKITNLDNNKFYIGQTKESPTTRFKRHLRKSTKEFNKFYTDIDDLRLKYKDNYINYLSLQVLHSNIPINQLNYHEEFYINSLGSCIIGLNSYSGPISKILITNSLIQNVISLYTSNISSHLISQQLNIPIYVTRSILMYTIYKNNPFVYII